MICTVAVANREPSCEAAQWCDQAIEREESDSHVKLLECQRLDIGRIAIQWPKQGDGSQPYARHLLRLFEVLWSLHQHRVADQAYSQAFDLERLTRLDNDGLVVGVFCV